MAPTVEATLRRHEEEAARFVGSFEPPGHHSAQPLGPPRLEEGGTLAPVGRRRPPRRPGESQALEELPALAVGEGGYGLLLEPHQVGGQEGGRLAVGQAANGRRAAGLGPPAQDLWVATALVAWAGRRTGAARPPPRRRPRARASSRSGEAPGTGRGARG